MGQPEVELIVSIAASALEEEAKKVELDLARLKAVVDGNEPPELIGKTFKIHTRETLVASLLERRQMLLTSLRFVRAVEDFVGNQGLALANIKVTI